MGYRSAHFRSAHGGYDHGLIKVPRNSGYHCDSNYIDGVPRDDVSDFYQLQRPRCGGVQWSRFNRWAKRGFASGVKT